VEPHEVRALLDPLPIRRLFGVGPVTERALLNAGYITFADLAGAEARVLQAVVGDRAKEVIQLARGEDEREVEPDRPPKSYGEENTFERDLRRGDEAISNALTTHAHAVARRLRSDGLRGRTVTLKVRLGTRSGQGLPASGLITAAAAGPAPQTPRLPASGLITAAAAGPAPQTPRLPASESGRYPLRTRSKSLPEPTDDAALIRRVALELWESSGIAEPIRLLGIALSNLVEVAGQATQLDLFAAADGGEDRGRKLGPALDRIRERFGEDAIQVGGRAPDKLTPSSRKKHGE
jgi:nucleotidyltransferase/DNA polymerase involved in DNA repair